MAGGVWTRTFVPLTKRIKLILPKGIRRFPEMILQVPPLCKRRVNFLGNRLNNQHHTPTPAHQLKQRLLSKCLVGSLV